jgi:hypothetical protein
MRAGKGVLLAGVLLLVSLGSAACAHNDSNRTAGRLLEAPDQKIARLASGLSVGEVEDRLGDPSARADLEEGEETLYYGLWQLVFNPDLESRIRSYRAGYWPSGKSFASLDRAMHRLPLGVSRGTVERRIGKTEAWEIIEFADDERLWYGNGRWKLSFREGELVRKQLTEQRERASLLNP